MGKTRSKLRTKRTKDITVVLRKRIMRFYIDKAILHSVSLSTSVFLSLLLIHTHTPIIFFLLPRMGHTRTDKIVKLETFVAEKYTAGFAKNPCRSQFFLQIYGTVTFQFTSKSSRNSLEVYASCCRHWCTTLHAQTYRRCKDICSSILH